MLRQSSPASLWTGGVLRRGGDIPPEQHPVAFYGATITASDGHFWIGKNTTVYCPTGIENLNCTAFSGSETVFFGTETTEGWRDSNDTISLAVSVPGGQQGMYDSLSILFWVAISPNVPRNALFAKVLKLNYQYMLPLMAHSRTRCPIPLLCPTGLSRRGSCGSGACHGGRPYYCISKTNNSLSARSTGPARYTRSLLSSAILTVRAVILSTFLPTHIVSLRTTSISMPDIGKANA